MNILDALKQLRDDIKTWVTNNLNTLNAKIDEKTIPIDSELSSTSTNPVQNKAIKKAIDNIPTFSGDYNDLTNAPDITEDGSGNMIIADESGNIIFKADAEGIHTTAVSLNGEAAATEKYVDEAVANIDIPEVDFTGYATEDYVDNKVADLVNSAPEALNTLGELAAALENHEDAYDALLETVGSKATHTDLENLKEELSESITAEAEDWKVVDGNGNIIFSVDNTGAHTTSMTLNGQSVEDMIDDKVDKVDGKGLSTNDFTDEYKTKLDGLENIEFEETDPTVPAWAKEENKPSYTADEVGALSKDTPLFSGDYNDLENAPDISEDDSGDLVIADKDGNIIFRSNGSGFETVNLAVQNITIDGKTIQEMIQEYVNSYLNT